jgi:hypothetical protein
MPYPRSKRPPRDDQTAVARSRCPMTPKSTQHSCGPPLRCRGYSKRYGSGDNRRTINVRFVKAPQVIEEDSYLDADNGTQGHGRPLAVGRLGVNCSPAARRAHGLAASILAVTADPQRLQGSYGDWPGNCIGRGVTLISNAYRQSNPLTTSSICCVGVLSARALNRARLKQRLKLRRACGDGQFPQAPEGVVFLIDLRDVPAVRL